jgi:hypothetical protein
MYSRQEAAQLKQEFWTAFGQYMAPVLSAGGEKINWINYKTGEKNIVFRMEADAKKASIAIELTHKDPEIRELYFEQLLQYKNIFNQAIQEPWTWKENKADEFGKITSKIYKEQTGISIFKKEDWPELISFFKPRIMALDEFWSAVKYGFEALR